MYSCIFEHIYIVGAGATPLRCAQLLLQMGLACELWETAYATPSFIGVRTAQLHIPYRIFDERSFLKIVAQTQPTVIISANNTYLFPPQVVEARHIRIINYHNSLLPHHRGMHAEAWSLYEGDTQTGITWHDVDAGIDTGNILAQRSLTLDDTVTSIQLLQRQAKVAVEALQAILPDVLQGKTIGRAQTCSKQASLHRARDIPNQGELSAEWDCRQIWNFLRAMDYGVLNTLGRPYIRYANRAYYWSRYRKLPSREKYGLEVQGRSLCLHNTILLENIMEAPDIPLVS